MFTPQEMQIKIQEMTRRIVKNFHPEKVVLFGSFAAGNAGPDSDVDLMVIMRVVGKKNDMAIAIRGHLHGLGLAKDIIVATPDEWERFRDTAGTLIRTVHEEGKTLYDRAA